MAAVAAGLSLGAGAARAALTPDILAAYNADRRANALPQVSVVNPAMQAGCANHDRYMLLNGGVQDGETPGRPGYTPTGNFQDGAAGGEVVAEDYAWSPGYEPWYAAPIHAYELFDPSVYQVGYADQYGFECMRMRGPDTQQPGVPPPVFYAWTGDGGRTNVLNAEHAVEYPYSPQQLAGIPATRLTGPNILLFSQGDAGTPISASIEGPSGAVQTALINAQTKNAVGDGGWFRGGGVLLPVHPLAAHTTYRATVMWSDPGAYTQQFSFTTGGRVVPSVLSMRAHTDRHGRWRFTVSGSPRIGVTLSAAGRAAIRPRVHGRRTGWVRLPHGLWKLCVTSLDERHPALTGCAQLQA
jgi:hypothetical protein